MFTYRTHPPVETTISFPLMSVTNMNTIPYCNQGVDLVLVISGKIRIGDQVVTIELIGPRND